ncbi:MAG TPA: hypothetical protein DEB12_12995 [Porphyromonadaceae bacterium]|nr:hypothetical protein [Porphyromonadaceae bacterium]
MFETIYKLKLKGAAFAEETILPLFSDSKERISLIYGKNGTGKSTISKAVLKASGRLVEELSAANLLDKQGQVVSIPQNPDERRVYVFNEDYVQENIRLKEDGLQTIIMFGQQVDLDNQITAAQAEFDAAEIARQQQEENYKQYTGSSLITAPGYYITKMNLALSGDNHWAGRIRVIDSSRRRNASVTDNTYTEIIFNKPTKPSEEIQQEFNEKLAMLRKAEAGTGKITTPVKSNLKISLIEEDAITLLAEQIERPELNKREEYLISLIEDGKSTWLSQMDTAFSNEETVACPFCLQPIDAEYRVSLSDSIRKVLSRIVEEHKDALHRLIVSKIVIDFQPYEALNSNILEDCKAKLQQLNDTIERFNATIQEKIDKPFTPIILNSIDIQEKLKVLNGALFVLEQIRTDYNKPFESTVLLRNELFKLNDNIAYYEILDFYNSFVTQDADAKAAKEKCDAVITASQQKKTALDVLNDQKKSVSIALEKINSSLRYVFFANGRLEVHSEDECYKLYSNGRQVKPSDVSVGERNILALCYFFTEILRQQEESKLYSEEMFLLIDDPISSFDRENKIGIMSLLKAKLNAIICANINSRIVLLTHDIQAFFDLQKICDEVKNNANRIHGNRIGSYKLWELQQKSLVDFQYKKRNEYSSMLNQVFVFGCSAPIDQELTIGNTMRRVLETYSTFFYKKGIDDVSCDETILSALSDQRYKRYFENLMYRLVLNGESHMEERARGGSDTDFVEMLTMAEKQKTARDIVLFIYLLNPTHVMAHLQEHPDAESNINSWCEDIKALNL